MHESKFLLCKPVQRGDPSKFITQKPRSVPEVDVGIISAYLNNLMVSGNLIRHPWKHISIHPRGSRFLSIYFFIRVYL